jgi:hypothetical protein
MRYFKFRAAHAAKGTPVKAAIFLGDVDRGFTPESRGAWLEFELKTSGTYSWYAKMGGNILDEGSSSGGSVTVLYAPKEK